MQFLFTVPKIKHHLTGAISFCSPENKTSPYRCNFRTLKSGCRLFLYPISHLKNAPACDVSLYIKMFDIFLFSMYTKTTRCYKHQKYITISIIS